MKKNNPILYLTILTVLLAIIYIGESSSLSIQGYVIAQQQQELDELKRAALEANSEFAQYNSIGFIRQNFTLSNMQIASFLYIDGQGALVKK